MKMFVTHEKDAERYVKCGWLVDNKQTVLLEGLNRAYTECTLRWPGDGVPQQPDGEYIEMVTFTPSQE